MVVLLCLVTAGCFAPRYEEGIGCSEAATCPPGLTCDPRDNRCWSTPPRYECRADGDCASGDCDESSGQCVDAVCGDGVVNEAAGEVCEPGLDACCAADCGELAPAGVECRPAAGPCDPAEACTGASAACPPDARAPAMTTCRAGSGMCDPAGVCDGIAPTCPGDASLLDGMACSDCPSGSCGVCMAGACTDLCGNGIVDEDAGEQCEPGDDDACPGDCSDTCACGTPRSCREYLAATPGLPDGVYTIDPDGVGVGEASFAVYCDMTSAAGGWTRVFYEDTSGGSFFLRDQFERNKDDPEAGLYAILNDLEKFRRDGEFELLMRWPGHVTYTEHQHWAQTSNPVTDSPGAIPTGYRAISVPYTSQGWSAGLQRSARTDYSLLDGTLSPLTNWYYAVGTTYCWGSVTSGCQPAPSGGAHVVELLVR